MKKIELFIFSCLIISNLILMARVYLLERQMIEHYNLDKQAQKDFFDVFMGNKFGPKPYYNAYPPLRRDFMWSGLNIATINGVGLDEN